MHTRKPSSHHPRALGLFGIGWAAALLALGLSALDQGNGPNGFDPPLPGDGALRQLLPQGWAFFTRDPQEARVAVWAKTPSGWESKQPGANALARHAFGFDRAARAHGVEMGALYTQVAKDAWVECRAADKTCLARLDEPSEAGSSESGRDDAAAVVISNPTPNPRLCGTLAFIKKPPVPWAWARTNPDVAMPGTVAKVVVRC